MIDAALSYCHIGQELACTTYLEQMPLPFTTVEYPINRDLYLYGRHPKIIPYPHHSLAMKCLKPHFDLCDQAPCRITGE
jgi:hypothetical protein